MSMIRVGVVLSLLFLKCGAHFPLVDNASGGEIFDKWANAAEATDITRSQFLTRVALCGHLYLWIKFNRPSSFDTLMVGGIVPVIERFKDVRVAVAVFGRGLPGTGATQDEITAFCDRSPVGRLCMGYDDLPEDLKTAHSEIQTSLGVTDLGVIAVPGVEDQSNCDFGEDPLTLSVTDSLYITSGGGEDAPFATYHDWDETHCFYHEEFQGNDMWVVQDKLIALAGEGDHYIAFWVPSDDVLGEPTEPAKFGAVFGDEGQSENFSGETILAGECSLPAQDFYEQDCHDYEKPFIPSAIESIYNTFLPETWLTGFLYFPWGGAPCIPSYAASVPNVYTCGDEEPDIACTGLCHNHGVCPADPSLNDGVPFDTSECSSDTDENGFPMCGETCARDICLDPSGENTTKFGPIGPACVEICKKECALFGFLFCGEEVCGMPSKECEGIYEEEHS